MSDNLPERYFGHKEIDLMARHAKAFAISGLFEDIRGEVQAYVKIAAGAEMGLLPFESMGAFDVIKGKVVANSGFLASKVKAHPKYDFRVIEISNDRCEILFREKVDLPNGSWQWDDLGSSVFTMEDAKQAGLLGRGDNYSKWSRNMLQSRAMSNGTRWFCPDVLSTTVYETGEIEPPAQRPEQEGGRTATVPEREPENVIDVEPEMGTAVQEPMTGTASATIDPETMKDELAAKQTSRGATKIPLTDDPDGPSHTFDPSVDPLLSVETVERLAEREAIAAAQREAAKAPEQVAFEAQQAARGAARDAEDMLAERKAAGKTQAEAPEPTPEDVAEVRRMADDLHSAREAEVAEQEQEPPFGGDDPLPPPLTDEQKIAAIGAMFRPADPLALPADLRAKVKTACTILEIWGKNTPTELFLLFGDDALSASTLERALAKALDDRQARIDAQKAQEAAQTPHEAPSSISQALKAQDEKVAKVEAVLSGLADVQRTKVEAGLERLGISSDAAARELWLSFGPASLDAGTLVEALEKPPWETPDGGEA